MTPDLPPGRSIELPERGTTFVRELGGPPGAPCLVLLHGWTVTADLNWFRCYAALARQYRVISMDLRGHGRGIRCRWFRMEDCADDVIALADQLGIERIIPVGYSMGGAVAQLTAHRHAERCAGLVLCATARQFHLRGADPRFVRALSPAVAVAATLTPDRLWQVLYDRLEHVRPRKGELDAWVAEEFRRSDPAALMQALVDIQRFDSREWIGALPLPISIVVTTNDETVPTLRQRRMAASVPHARVIEVDAPHRAAVEHSDVFVPALLNACRAVTSARRPSSATG